MKAFKSLIITTSILSTVSGYAGNHSSRPREDTPKKTKTFKATDPLSQLPLDITNQIFSLLGDDDSRKNLSQTCYSLNERKKHFLQTLANQLTTIYSRGNDEEKGEAIAQILTQYDSNIYKSTFNPPNDFSASQKPGSFQEKLLRKMSSHGVIKMTNYHDVFWGKPTAYKSRITEGRRIAIYWEFKNTNFFHTQELSQDRLAEIDKIVLDFCKTGYPGYEFFDDSNWQNTKTGILVATQTQLKKSENREFLNAVFLSQKDLTLLTDLDNNFTNNDLKIYELRKLIIANSKRDIKKIPNNFLHYGLSFSITCSLEELDISDLINVEEIGSDCMRGTYRLEKVKLPPLAKTKRIGPQFMAGCGIIKADFNFPAVTEVGEYFINSNCLEEANFKFPALKKMKDWAFFRSLFTKITITVNPNAEIGDHLFHDSKPLDNIDWAKELRVKKLGKTGFLEGTSITEQDKKYAYKMITGKEL